LNVNAICPLIGLAMDSASQAAYEGSIPFARSDPTNLWEMGASGIFGRQFGQPAVVSVQRAIQILRRSVAERCRGDDDVIERLRFSGSSVVQGIARYFRSM
jgi:hypothetical protein